MRVLVSDSSELARFRLLDVGVEKGWNISDSIEVVVEEDGDRLFCRVSRDWHC